ncbi:MULTISPECIES: MarR family winged helix-turn-helix transcriptional regulator [Cyanophyceae]|uniref:MarR family winged helix-turn-helix transcriptional regulator n=1 Tax=Cyanophyceae TaxID=3028117 RepID=UPI00016DC3D3|nr:MULTISPECIES: MarR family transcriptional regulator [Cyanophyceae]ACB01105.1 transcriptional regulator, MarR family [Picosynechococcus sp. PCC 7002]SMH48444.1 DNA-binding transcriptional regulator, MarR family [Picosynechococcus sp. OG1]SMQ81319.1 DNA-binding transcriptional regulator, MarR family [Synechococcus sp. 7002]
MNTQGSSSSLCAASLMTVIPVVTRFLRAELRTHGQPHFSLSQLRVLYFLNRQPQASLSEVADYLDVTRPTMSAMVERLVQRNLVQRQQDPHERRRIALSLTDHGTAELDRVYGATLASVTQRLEGLSAEQTAQMMQGFTILEGIFAEK